jgi:light-regulated signal transduction histidine kinase (bacteriophytochrome)
VEELVAKSDTVKTFAEAERNATPTPFTGAFGPIELIMGSVSAKLGNKIATNSFSPSDIKEQLKRSNEELSQFAYIASHDLQEPLRMVSSYTQLLAKRYAGQLDADADEFIGFAVDGAVRMQRLIQDLLAFSRVGTNKINLARVSSKAALDYALTNISAAIEDSSAVITWDELPTVRADETQLVQLFQNLICNAIKYQQQEIPRVHISAVRNSDRRWNFSVRDNGLGIDPEYFDRIFGMFQRLHTREQFSGTGIGLAICKKIIDRHGGSISVASAPGEGSVFSFSLGEHNHEMKPQ